MDELSSPAPVIEIANPGSWVRKYPSTLCKVLLLLAAVLACVSSLPAQSARPTGQPPPPRAIFTPKPAYRPEWAKQGLTGKGVVLVTIDKQTGNVTGARMLTSTGNQQLDGAALQAYSQWRFATHDSNRVCEAAGTSIQGSQAHPAAASNSANRSDCRWSSNWVPQTKKSVS